jgi:hypothetical protein
LDAIVEGHEGAGRNAPTFRQGAGCGMFTSGKPILRARDARGARRGHAVEELPPEALGLARASADRYLLDSSRPWLQGP